MGADLKRCAIKQHAHHAAMFLCLMIVLCVLYAHTGERGNQFHVRRSLYQPLEDNIDVRNVCKYNKPPRGVAIVDLSSKNLDGELVISDIKPPKITSTVMGVPLTVKETPTPDEVRDMASELVEYLANPLPKK